MTSLFLIERDREFANCLARILQAEGFDVICTETVEQALANLANTTPDAAIIDLNDGKVMGPADITALADRFNNVPILVTAHYQTPEIACKALGKGATDYLLKPFGTREILDRINKMTGRGRTDSIDPTLDDFASSIRFISDIDDIVQICLDQLAGTLHLTDCLVALRSDGGFRVAAARGYHPDPVGQTLKLSGSTIDLLAQNSIDDVTLATEGVQEIVRALALRGHRPFPTLMPLEDPDDPENSIRGFVMGHGALVLEQEDLLEMERFLAQVSWELASLPDTSELKSLPVKYDREGEFRIPELSRIKVVNAILADAEPYLQHDSDEFWLRLCLDEAIANAIIHGHNEPMEHPQHTVLVKYHIGPSRFVFVVEDSGEGFNPEHVPDPTAEENLLNVSGRGIFIMRKILDEVVYNDRGNQVTMVKILDGKPLKPVVAFDELDFLMSGT